MVDGRIAQIVLSVDYDPAENEPNPRMADFRIRTSKPVWLKAAVEGDALTAAKKTLVNFEPWGEPWRKRTDGSFQVLAYESTSTERVSKGQIAKLTFASDEYGPIKFSIERREQTFAPPDADAALQGSAYDGNVIVTR